MKNFKAFTLVELLVVISIIAVLLAVLMPALNKARQKAKKVVCSSNMRQMGVALQCYFQDSEFHLPAGHSCNITDPNQYWLKILSKYLKQELLFKCPADTAKDFAELDKPLSSQSGKRLSSFVINALLDPTQGYDCLKKIKNPKYCVYVSEKPSRPDMAEVDHIHPDSWGFKISKAKNYIAWDRHSKKSNYLFADGHCELTEIEKTYSWPGSCLWFPQSAPVWPTK